MARPLALAALSLGQVFVGTCNEDVGSVLVQRLMESSDAELDDSVSRFLCLGLGLLFLGKMEKVDAIIEAVKTVEHKMGQYAELTLETCAYAGTGNVLKVQRLLELCGEHLAKDEEDEAAAAAAAAPAGTTDAAAPAAAAGGAGGAAAGATGAPAPAGGAAEAFDPFAGLGFGTPAPAPAPAPASASGAPASNNFNPFG